MNSPEPARWHVSFCKRNFAFSIGFDVLSANWCQFNLGFWTLIVFKELEDDSPF